MGGGYTVEVCKPDGHGGFEIRLRDSNGKYHYVDYKDGRTWHALPF